MLHIAEQRHYDLSHHNFQAQISNFKAVHFSTLLKMFPNYYSGSKINYKINFEELEVKVLLKYQRKSRNDLYQKLQIWGQNTMI